MNVADLGTTTDFEAWLRHCLRPPGIQAEPCRWLGDPRHAILPGVGLMRLGDDGVWRPVIERPVDLVVAPSNDR